MTGSLTGVGIWFAATVLSPRAISGLIHTYVWGWAAEWVFFIVEIVAIYVYYYTFNKVHPKTHLRIGLIYAVTAWLSMVVITGILGFMMTPGTWLETGSFFGGFFNQTYWPQLFFRTAMMFVIAGAYAALVAATLKNGGRETVRRIAGRWGLVGLSASGLFALWYYFTLPEQALENLAGLTYVDFMMKFALAVSMVAMAYFFILASGRGWFVNTWVGVGMMVLLFAGVVGGESVREFVRRPYLIPGYMYSNQIIGHPMDVKGIPSEAALFDQEGLLVHYPLVPEELTKVTSQNYLAAGEVLIKVECLACHTLAKGGRNSLPDILEGIDAENAFYMLEDLSTSYMPPFVGTSQERKAAAAYLAEVSGGTLPEASWFVESSN